MTQIYLTDRDVQNFGPEVIDLAQRAAIQVMEPQLDQLGQQNLELRQQLAREAKARMDREIEAEIPNYREIDRDPRWLGWLQGSDSLSGRVRQVLLNEAIRDGNTWRVLAIFRAFMAQHLPPGVRPRRVAAQQQRVYSRQEIARLYSQHHKGAYKGREAEWQALERDIIAAGAQGRILNPVDVAGK